MFVCKVREISYNKNNDKKQQQQQQQQRTFYCIILKTIVQIEPTRK